MDKKLENIVALVNHVESMRQMWEPMWRDIKQYVIPHRGFALDNEEISLHSSKIIDATATRAVRITASGLLSGLTSPARPWFRLRFSKHEDNESSEKKQWLDAVEDTLRKALLHTGFYQNVHNMFTELVTYGSSNIYIENHPIKHLQFSCLSCGEFAWAGDDIGTVDTVVRRYQVPVRFAAERFGANNLHFANQELLRHNPYALIELVHIVCPTENVFAPMPYQSITYESSPHAEKILHIGGYFEFPHIVARWDTSASSVYGYSPAMDTLPDIKMLQEMAKSQISAIHKVVNPPMKVPTSFKSKLNLIPGAPNYVNSTQNEAITPLYQINPDVHAVTNKIEDVRNAIKEGFFNDLFLLFAKQKGTMTAQEVLERGDEKLLLLGPVIERHQTEILTPLLNRTLAILSRSGLLPEAPKGMKESDCSIDYISALAQAQKIQTGNTIRQLVKDVSMLATIDTTVLNKIDCTQIVDELAICNAVPSRIIRSDSEALSLQDEISKTIDTTNKKNLDHTENTENMENMESMEMTESKENSIQNIKNIVLMIKKIFQK